MRIFDHAAGKWPRIISALLGEEFTNTRKHQPCPRGDGTDRYRFSDQVGKGNFFCACSDGRADGFDLIQCARDCNFRQACDLIESVIGETPDREAAQPKKKVERLDVMTVTESKYLASRGLEVAPGLRWTKAIDYFEDGKKIGTYAAMLGEIVKGDGSDFKFLGYHATYLLNGAKAPVNPVRKILEGGVTGGSVRLYPAAEAMGVAEGIETAIAAKMIAGVPVWAALNTSMLASWEPPAIARKVFIFGDRDSNFAGQAAAYALARKLKAKGLEVVVELPGAHDLDWNDVLLEMRKKPA